MTPERWRQIGDLFDAAVRLEPAQREAWLRCACGEDEDLRAEVSRLLTQDERADGDGFLTPPESAGEVSGSDGDLAPARRSPSLGRARAGRPRRSRLDRRHRLLFPQGRDRRGHWIEPLLRNCFGGACAAARTTDYLHLDPGDDTFLDARRPRG